MIEYCPAANRDPRPLVQREQAQGWAVAHRTALRNEDATTEVPCSCHDVISSNKQRIIQPVLSAITFHTREEATLPACRTCAKAVRSPIFWWL